MSNYSAEIQKKIEEGNLALDNKNLEEAEVFFDQALKKCGACREEDINGALVAKALCGLGRCCVNNPQKATDLFEQALVVYKNYYGEDAINVEIATALYYLGRCYKKMESFECAVEYFERAHVMAQKCHINDDNPYDIADCWNSLGICYYKLGDYKKALQHYEQAWNMCKSRCEDSDKLFRIAASSNNIGMCYYKLGDYQKAIQYYAETLVLREVEESKDSSFVQALVGIGVSYKALGDIYCAIRYFEWALELETEDDASAYLLQELGLLHFKNDDIIKTIQCEERALDLYKSFYGEQTNHPHIASVLFNLETCYKLEGNKEKSRMYRKQRRLMDRALKKEQHKKKR